MQLTDRIHLVASGASGVDLTDRWDAHAYLVDGGSEAALIDAGLGRDVDGLLAGVSRAGVALDRLRTVLVTHAHPDHCGAVSALQERLADLEVAASPEVARILRVGDEDAMSVPAGKRSEFYPPDFRAGRCPVEVELDDGAALRIGDVTVEALATPGHASGHLAYRVAAAGRTTLFAGDLVFFGGRISLLNTWDCDLRAYADSLTRFRDAGIDALLPGHHGLSLCDGQRHLDAAIRRLDAGFVPPSIV